MKWIARSAAVWAAFSWTAAAEDRWQVTAHLDIFQLPEKEALLFIPRLSDPNEAAAAITARALNGEKAVYRSSEERRYAIEYQQEDPRIGVPPDAPIKLPDAAGYPSTNFETRNCGVQMEFSATVHPRGELMLLQCAVTHTVLKGWTRYESAVRADGLKLHVEQPDLVVRATSTAVLAIAGKPILLGSYRMQEAAGMFELHVLSASVRRLNVEGIKVPSSVPPDGEMKAVTSNKLNRALRLEMLTFSLSAREAIAFRGQLLDRNEATQAVEKLIAQSGSDSVKLVDWQSVPSVARTRTVTQNTREFRYGIEFQMSNSFGLSRVQFFEGPNFEGPNWDGESLFEPMTTFETRNMGTLLEVECEADDTLPSFVGMQFTASNVVLPHFFRWGAGPHGTGKATYIYQPQFERRSSSASAAVEIGKPHLVRFAREPGASNRFEIAILRANRPQP